MSNSAPPVSLEKPGKTFTECIQPLYRSSNGPASSFTAKPSKYPQGKFRPKPCRWCSAAFEPQAPSHLYCGDACSSYSHSDKYLRRAYGISLKEYRQMLVQQAHKCKLCFGEGFLMKDTHSMKLVVDHCHTSGKVRGLLCHNCNRALGLLQDNRQTLERALAYLKQSGSS